MLINIHLMASAEKPFSLVRESLVLRRRFRRELGETFPLKTIAKHFSVYYQDGHPPPVTKWLPSIVEGDMREMLKDHQRVNPPQDLSPQPPELSPSLPQKLPLIHHLKVPLQALGIKLSH